ncbi:MAG: hypothetical protein LH606_14185 [Cytophagaceae bacterium]|nr:hypothetical protein [Cytophagaceae bacterium]
MLIAILGTYENGQITLDEQPPFQTKTKVVVTFLDEIPTQLKNTIPGSLAGKKASPDDDNEPLDN